MRRHGLRLYSADTATWSHRDRALAAGSAPAERWESLTPEARQDQPPSELLAMSLHRERGAMVVDDVGVLPSAPLVVAEGAAITPSCLPPGARAVWILPSAERQERQLQARDGRSHVLYRLLAEEIGADVRSASAPVVAIDGVAEMVAAVEAQFADVLAANPDLKAYVLLGGWAQQGCEAFNATGKQYDARFKDGSLVVVAGDTVGCQLDTVKAGYSNVNVGQRPYEMGHRAPDIMIDIINGKKVDNPMYTGLDECTKENVDKCVAG